MISTQLQNILIFNIVIILFFAINTPVLAMEKGSVSFNDSLIDYSKIDKATTKKSADSQFNLAIKTIDKKEQSSLYNSALRKYYILTNLEPLNDYNMIQMARIYDYENKDDYAKAYFSRALRTHMDCPDANYYLGDYYLKREEYRKAINAYNRALVFGHVGNEKIFYKMAIIYEKLGDLEKAELYYNMTSMYNKNNKEAKTKTSQLGKINYSETGYYSKANKNE